MNASAFVVGPRDGAGAALTDLAHALKFARVERYAGLSRAEKQAAITPLLFFFCAAVSDVLTLKPVANAIRFSTSLKLRFSPLIYFARNPSAETIKACISLGFDDVIALPFGSNDLGERVFRQVGRPQTYYETATYFGPDRRRNPRGSTKTEDNGGYRQIEILRHPDTGIDILRDDFQVVL
jgi:hypothetical protein